MLESRTERLARRHAPVSSLRRQAAIVLLAVVLAGCGDDGGEPAAQSANTPPPPPTQANPPPQPAANSAPTISGSPPSQVMTGNQFDFAPVVNDPDGDSLTFEVQNKPAWASFDSATGRLSGTPGAGDVGSYAGIRIGVSDGRVTTNLNAFSVTVVATALGTATLTWTPPTQKADGSPLALGGYRVYWGTSPRQYSSNVRLDNPGVASFLVENLTPAVWYFAVTAFDSSGTESDYSNEATKRIR